MKNKTPPKRQPATMADVKRAKDKATRIAMQRMLEMFMYSLKDLGASDESLDIVMEKFRYTVDGINRGDIKWSDIQKTLKSEYNVEIAFT